MRATICKWCRAALAPVWEEKQVPHYTDNLVGTQDMKLVTERTGRLLGYGYAGQGHFCSTACGWRYAVRSLEKKKKKG